jgi:hypothetical protein
MILYHIRMKKVAVFRVVRIGCRAGSGQNGYTAGLTGLWPDCVSARRQGDINGYDIFFISTDRDVLPVADGLFLLCCRIPGK